MLVGSHKGWSAASTSTRPRATCWPWRWFPDEQSDPCEVYFSDYREMEGRIWPGQMEVRYGDELFAVLKINEVRVEK